MILFTDDDVKKLLDWAAQQVYPQREKLAECTVPETVQVLGFLLAGAANVACWLSGRRFKT